MAFGKTPMKASRPAPGAKPPMVTASAPAVPQKGGASSSFGGKQAPPFGGGTKKKKMAKRTMKPKPHKEPDADDVPGYKGPGDNDEDDMPGGIFGRK